MAVELFSDNASTTINQIGGIGSGDGTVTVASNTGFPSANVAGLQFAVIIDTEEIEVTSNSTTTWTILRGQNGTSQQAHSNGAVITHVLTKQSILNGFMTKIDEAILTGSVATVTFPNLLASLPTSFRHLHLVWMGRGDNASINVTAGIRFNADAGANYDYEIALVSGSTANVISPTNFTNATNIGLGYLTGSSATANYTGNGEADIVNYGGTTFYKAANIENNLMQGTGVTDHVVISASGHWRNTAAVTSMTLILSAGNWISGSVFSLYGIP